MSNTETVSINTGDEAAKGPSLEESLKSLQEEGLIAPDDETPVAQGGAKDTKQGSTEERPAWLPEKFKSPEDLAKAYDELQRKQGAGKTDETPADAPQVTPEERKAAEDATKKAGLDLNEVSVEYNTQGGLSEATYSKLAEAGYPKDMVDIYIEGLTARYTTIETEAKKVAGGDDGYGEMIDWAIGNLSPEEQAAYDKAVNSGDRHRVLQAVKALKADYERAIAADRSEEPEAVVTAKGKTSGNVYSHQDEWLADLADPRYDSNEAFRQQVMAKLARSKI